MKLEEDLDNLKEERSRQTRLAATVTDEMYKDSQVGPRCPFCVSCLTVVHAGYLVNRSPCRSRFRQSACFKRNQYVR